MLFGEIVEPTTRALLIEDEDVENLPKYKSPAVEWEGSLDVPDPIENLIFLESKKILQIGATIVKNKIPKAKLKNEEVSLYSFDKCLVLLIGDLKNLAAGELVELVAPLIKRAKNVHAITSNPISMYQPMDGENFIAPITLSRCLTTHQEVPFNFCKRLEAPNLIQGFGAGIFSYCLSTSNSTSLWIIFMDNMPLDSKNSSEIVKLLRTLGFDMLVDWKFDFLTECSNLYM